MVELLIVFILTELRAIKVGSRNDSVAYISSRNKNIFLNCVSELHFFHVIIYLFLEKLQQGFISCSIFIYFINILNCLRKIIGTVLMDIFACSVNE